MFFPEISAIDSTSIWRMGKMLYIMIRCLSTKKMIYEFLQFEWSPQSFQSNHLKDSVGEEHFGDKRDINNFCKNLD